MPTDHRRLLSDTFVRATKAAAPGQRDHYWDTKVGGFGLRVTDRGAKSFVLYTRYPPSKAPSRRALGDASRMSLSAARKMAREWLDLIEQGIDPQAVEQQRQEEAQRSRRITFGAVAEEWLSEVVRGKQRQGRTVELDLRREFIPRWGNRPITEITALDIREAIKEVKDRAPSQARNILGHLKRLFAWAEAQQVYGLDQSPVERLKPTAIVGKKNPRQRVLTDNEMRALWHAAVKLDYPYGSAFRMLALTGQRKSEVAEARWREFDLTKKLWTIPPERMKGDAAHEVPLTDDVMALLEALPRFNNGDFVFSTTFGAGPVNGFSTAKVKLDHAMAAELGSAVDPFVTHDVRRTMRTGLSALPIADRVRELVIAHAQVGMHKVYDLHSYRAEKLHALNLWQARLRNIVNPLRPTENLLHFPGTGA
jgi:integrase